MRKWILFALIGLVLLYVFGSREGFQDTNTIKGPPYGESDYSQIARMMPGTLIAAIHDAKPDANPSTTAGQRVLVQGDIENIMSVFHTSVYQPASTSLTAGDVDRFLSTYPLTPMISANKADVKTLLVAYFVTPTHGSTNAELTKSQKNAASYAENSGYADILKSMQDANNGPLPPPITESPDTDSGASRSTTGDVFSPGGPFSGVAATGRGSGEAAAAGMTGNTYGQARGPMPSTSPFDAYPKSSPSAPSPAPLGSSLRVKGPSWGGKGQSAASASASSGIPNPFLYGPGSGNKSSSGSDGAGFGFQLNSGDTSMLPSLDSLGSNPENQYAVTSRVPGDQDLVPNPYMQSSSYSLANNSQKTDPVPFLANFSAFQR
jgi:hypothetical protein